MVFNAIKKPFKADNFLFFSCFLDINFLFFEAQNIYFVPNCTGQPVYTIIISTIYGLLEALIVNWPHPCGQLIMFILGIEIYPHKAWKRGH